MLIRRRPIGPATAALNDVVAAAEREAASVEPDPLDAAMLAGLRDAMQGQGEDLAALRRRMVRLGMETLG